MRPQVNVEGALLGETLAAVRAAVGFFARVHALVQLQVRLLGEALAAHRAAERLLA